MDKLLTALVFLQANVTTETPSPHDESGRLKPQQQHQNPSHTVSRYHVLAACCAWTDASSRSAPFKPAIAHGKTHCCSQMQRMLRQRQMVKCLLLHGGQADHQSAAQGAKRDMLHDTILQINTQDQQDFPFHHVPTNTHLSTAQQQPLTTSVVSTRKTDCDISVMTHACQLPAGIGLGLNGPTPRPQQPLSTLARRAGWLWLSPCWRRRRA